MRWTLVRTFGELQILTKASYALLVIVPVLAGTWTAVRAYVVRQDHAISGAETTFDTAATNLAHQTAILRSLLADRQSNPPSELQSQVRNTLDDIAAKASAIRSQVVDLNAFIRNAADEARNAIASARLPTSLAFGFFAALFVAIGHAIYQAAAPPALRTTPKRHLSQMQSPAIGRTCLRACYAELVAL